MELLHHLPPSEQILESFVPGRYIGFPISKYFASRFTYLSEEDWTHIIAKGKITVNGQPVNPNRILEEHDWIVSNLGLRQEPPANRSLNVLYEDENLRVFNKAAPIPVHPSGRYFKNSMTEVLKGVYPHETPRPVQRLDAGTTGVLVFARTKEAATFLMNEFSNQRVYKEYLAIVEGAPVRNRFIIDAPIGKITNSKWGIGPAARLPKPALTKFECLNTLNDRSLLKAIPHSGRTNQIRVHLASVNLPIWNDPVYGKEDAADNIQLGLHAYRLRFRFFQRVLDIIAPWPEHFKPLVSNETIDAPGGGI